jgi:hypothetical protein
MTRLCPIAKRTSRPVTAIGKLLTALSVLSNAVLVWNTVRISEITVNDSECVSFGDCVARLQDVVDSNGGWECPLTRKHSGQVSALKKLHDDVWRAAIEDAGVDDSRDVFARKADRVASLALEPVARLRIGTYFGQQELERDEG